MEPKAKREKLKIATREPHKRTPAGMFDNLRQLPHPVEEMLGLSAAQFPSSPEHDESTGAPTPVGPSKINGPSNTDNPSEFSGPPNINSQTDSDRPSRISSPPESSGPPTFEVPAHRNDGPPESSGQAIQERAAGTISPSESARLSYERRPAFSLLNSLPDETGYMPAFHQITDYLDRQLTPSEQAAYRQLLRLTWGFGRPTTVVSIPKLAERANVGATTARDAVKGLEGKGLVKKLGHVFGSNQVQGIEFEVFAPLALVRNLEGAARRRRPQKADGPLQSGGLPKSDGMKESVSSSKEKHTQTGVGVGSRFTLEECQRYARHLKATGQGITNPGGYATKIFRSGEADALIEAFLNPPAPVDITQCPDCRGQGFYYPDGIGNGPVAKCKHEKLRY